MDVSYCRWNLHKFIVDDGTDPIPVWRKDGKMKETKVRRGCVVRSLLVMYIISGLLLVLLALIVSRVEKEDAVRRDRHLCAFLRYRGLCPGKMEEKAEVFVGAFGWDLICGNPAWGSPLDPERKPAAHPLYGNCICHLHRIGNAGRYAELRKQKKCFSFRHLYAII